MRYARRVDMRCGWARAAAREACHMAAIGWAEDRAAPTDSLLSEVASLAKYRAWFNDGEGIGDGYGNGDGNGVPIG